jgi:hypothetical protein
MTTWNEIAERFPSGSHAQIILKNNLIKIFNYAEKNGIDPSTVENVKKSKFIEILHEASIAVRREDKDRLLDLFSKANTMTVYEMRDLLGNKSKDTILVTKLPDGKNRISLTDIQMGILSRSTWSNFIFTVKEEE